MAPSGPDPEKMSGPEQKPPEKKLYVQSDEDWKAQAQREKERLASETQTDERRRGLPPASFMGFVGEIGLQAMLALGLVQLEGAEQPPVDLEAARYTIDVLGLLQEKTKGNLTPEEKRHMDDLLKSLRMGYVRVAKLAEAESRKVQEPPKKDIIT